MCGCSVAKSHDTPSKKSHDTPSKKSHDTQPCPSHLSVILNPFTNFLVSALLFLLVSSLTQEKRNKKRRKKSPITSLNMARALPAKDNGEQLHDVDNLFLLTGVGARSFLSFFLPQASKNKPDVNLLHQSTLGYGDSPSI